MADHEQLPDESTPLREELLKRYMLNVYVQQRPTDIEELYHYTSPEGLAGIVGGQSVWMTNAAYVNDEHELTYPAQLARAVVQATIESEPDARRRQFLSVVITALESHVFFKAWYIASLTTVGDSLSQWRAYCPGGGYSIGFDARQLIGPLKLEDGYLYGPVTYDQQEQVARVQAVTHQYLAIWQDLRVQHTSMSDTEYDGEVAWALTSWLSRELIFFKIPAFESEHEWRLARQPLRNENVFFRTRAGVLTPYVSARLGAPDAKLPIARLFVSPLGDIELAAHAAQVLLTGKEYSGVPLLVPRYHLRF